MKAKPATPRDLRRDKRSARVGSADPEGSATAGQQESSAEPNPPPSTPAGGGSRSEGGQAASGLEGEVAAQPTEGVSAAMPPGFTQLIWAQIEPDPLNPRTHFDDDSLDDLANSILRDGLLENLVVRPGVAPPYDGSGQLIGPDGEPAPIHRLVAGERRHRAIGRLIASGRWGPEVPILCRIVDLDEAGHRRVALVENLQRQDLRPIDQANGLKALMEITGAGTAEVAAEIGFTQRFVQQRLQLLELPQAQQEKLNAGDLTIEEARRWLANRPKLLDLTPRQWLIALEVFDRQERFPIPDKPSYATTTTECGEAGRTDPDAVALAYPGPQLISRVEPIYEDGFETGRFQVGVPSWSLNQLQLKFGAVDHEDVREKALLAARAEADAPASDGSYAIAWLNGPFEPSAERLAELAAARAEHEADQQRRAREREAVQAERAAAIQAAEAARARVRQLAMAFGDGERRAAEVPDLAKALGAPLPWKWLESTDDFAGQLVDADGDEVDLDSYQTPEGLKILVMAAVNAAAGQAAAFGHAGEDPPQSTPPGGGSRSEGGQAASGLEGEVAAQPTEGVSAETPADPDPDFSPALRRLAGAPAPAEA